MKMLVIGGSYFLGRVFTILASKEHDLTLVNRGTFSMKDLGVREFVADRNDEFALGKLPKEDYDVVVDFCAYKHGDIGRITQKIKGNIKKYVLISTVDVYQKKDDVAKTELAPLHKTKLENKKGEEIEEKVQLENELVSACEDRKMQYAILRPSIIYGPYNYALRESEYVRRLLYKDPIPIPTDSNTEFQLVYIKDVAKAVLETLKKDDNVVYNVCSAETITYKKFFEVLEKVSGMKPNYKKYTVEQILENQEFAPFPLMYRDTNLCDGTKIERECNFKYTPFEEGMEKTFNAFKKIYSI